MTEDRSFRVRIELAALASFAEFMTSIIGRDEQTLVQINKTESEKRPKHAPLIHDAGRARDVAKST
jgi:hypothetical protein